MIHLLIRGRGLSDELTCGQRLNEGRGRMGQEHPMLLPMSQQMVYKLKITGAYK